MKTGGEFLRIIPATHDAAGQPLEPEERPATEATAMPIEVNLSGSPVIPGGAAPAGFLRGMVGIETSAGEVAQAVSTRCELCEHFRREEWQKHIAALSQTPSGIRQIDALRGELLGRQSVNVLSATVEDLFQIDATIKRDFGICVAFTESEGTPVACVYYGGCPTNDQRFKPRSLSDRRLGSAGFDQVMRRAQGRES